MNIAGVSPRFSRVLVTGASGFIGSHLTEKLVCSGYRVRAFVHYNSRGSLGWLESCSPGIISSIEIHRGDIRDPESVNRSLVDCDAVLHLAALISIPDSFTSTSSYLETNVLGTFNMLRAAQANQISRFVMTSTSEVYGSAEYLPIDEKHPLIGRSPYAATKIAAEQIALAHFYSFGLPVVVVRPFNTYGPRQSTRAIIPSVIAQLLSNQPQLHSGNLSPTRDFTFVSDTVDGFISALLAENVIGETINLGTGYEIAMTDLVATIMKLAGISKPIRIVDERMRPGNSEVNRLLSDNSKAQHLLHWKPRLPGQKGLEEGLLETIDWFRYKFSNSNLI